MRKKTKKPKPYESVKGTQQRRRLLRELGRDPARKKFAVSPREVRRSTAKMFGFRPLTKLSPEERALLKRFTKDSVHSLIDSDFGDVGRMLRGESRIIPEQRSSPEDIGRERARKIFSAGRSYGRDVFVTPGGGWRQGLGPGSRNLREYKRGGFDVLKLVKIAYKRKGGKIRVLDVGAATAQMLAELKKEMGNKVETHAISPEDMPMEKVDFYHMLMAEHLPREFRRKFDIIVSNRALEYALLPDIALRNIAESLALGGVAYVQWRPGRVSSDVEENRVRMEKFLSKYKRGIKASAGAKRIVKEGNEEIKSDAEVDKKIAQGLNEYGLDAILTLAWCNEVARLKKSKNFEVEIIGPTMSAFGRAPGMLVIKRNF